jgi:hypothetical protein
MLLKDWILKFQKYDHYPNHIFITSERASIEKQHEFAEWLKTNLVDSPIKYVDVWPPDLRCPNATAFESEKLIEIRRKSRRVTWLRPQSQVAELFGSQVSWIVDLVEDSIRGRSPYELALPAVKTSVEILNAPNPPTVTRSTLPRFGLGVDSINIRCTNREELISHWLPTDKEILEELLSSQGLRFTEDEKRACYLPAIRLLGGLEQASSSLSGVRGLVLQELAKGPATVHELKGRLQLGNGKIPELNRDKHFESLLKHLTVTQQRVGRQRLLHHWRRTLPKDSKLQSLLEHWVANSILRRLWRIGSCPVCQTTHHEAILKITHSYRCPGCGASIPLPESLVIDYQLHPILEAAINQGLMPVVLTGRFLKNLTRDGFLWLPGLKYTHAGVSGDIDIVASCDGRLILVECKTRDQSDPLKVEWAKIVDQVKALATVGRACKASLVLLASMIDSYPQAVKDEVKAIGDECLSAHLLDKDDLLKGHRWVKENENTMSYPLSLNDFIPEQHPDALKPVFDEPRIVATSSITHFIGKFIPSPKTQDHSEGKSPAED